MDIAENRGIRALQIGILLLNCLSIMGISIFIYITIEMIGSNYAAREFLTGVKSVAWQPVRKVWQLGLLLLFLNGNMLVRDKMFYDKHKIILFSLIFEFILCIIIIVLLNFNYNGILLLVFSNIILHAKDGKNRYLLAAIAIGSFIVADYELLSISYRLYSIHDYINYYSASTKQYLLSIYNILTSMNVILFVIYCINIINKQQGNIDKIHALNGQMQQANEQLKEYTAMAEKMAETRERNRLAREIHDTLGHTLTGIAAGVDASIAMLDMDPEQIRQQLEMISGVTRNGIMEIRRSVKKLRPDALERLKLEYAINKMVTDMSTMSDVHIYFDCKVKKLKFSEDEETAIYRIIQESLTNAMRHGHAGEIWITIDKVDGEIILQVKDNGIGCKEIKKGFGTQHIEERIEMLCGTVTFDGSDGFTVNVRIPIRWGENYD